MPTFPSVFPWWWVSLTAIIAMAVSYGLLRWRFKKDFSVYEAILIAAIVGASVLGWRWSANVPQFNDDPVAGLSPNDWLSPVFTYVCLSLYAAFCRTASDARWQQARALLTLVCFVVNVLVI